MAVKMLAEYYIERCKHGKVIHDLVLSIDDDSRVMDSSSESAPGDWFEKFTHLQGLAEGVEQSSTRKQLANGTTAHLVTWKTDDADAPGIPRYQALERVVCAALAAVYPEEARSVAEFLENAGHDRPSPNLKSHAWSYMAHKWPEDGCERFFEHVWEDDRVAAELTRRLEEAVRVAELLAGA
ncbi:MAG: hypothetical protein JXR96_09745 [Deltaproteobacteria bacterium]|nr:hypothetical protein [Deltaproteobacteria bacterium]